MIEGNDGTGKSTQVERLQIRLGGVGIQSVQIHEPDGPPISALLRDIIKNGALERDAWTNVMLFTASRRVSWLQHIQPALESGQFVLAARNWYSTIVYQGYGQGVSLDAIEDYTRDNVSPLYLEPDLSLILSLGDASTRYERINKRGELDNPDTFESMPDDFQDRVNRGYEEFARRRQISVVDASRSIDEVESVIWEYVHPLVVPAP